MGAAVSTSVAESVQKAVNRTYQSANNECTATCNQLISGNVIVLDNSKAGDITFTQRCTGDASCYMKNALEQAVTTFQGANVSADAAPALFPGIQVNTSVSSNKQDITNELTQIMENLCTANVNQTIQDNIVYATDSTLGNIGFLQEGNASAKCVMENSGRLQLQMRQEGDTTAKAGRNISLIAGLIGLIIVVVIIIIVVSQIRKNTSEKGGGSEIAAGPNGQKKPSMLGNMQGGLQGMMGANRGGASGAKSMGGVRR